MKKQSFAFKIADKKADTVKKSWEARDKVAVAGCSEYYMFPIPHPEYRSYRNAPDDGYFC